MLGQPKVYDGLKLGELPELDLDSLKFSRVPTLVFISAGSVRLVYPTVPSSPNPYATL